ncbi:MAG: hypothetical protein H0T43_12855 [Solirubrobacterales bacterium]|nr:hypothetical protein [Solirubrobacterales bacterium]
MKSRKLTLATAAAALAAAALAPAGAQAADQVVSGTTIASTLSLGVPVAATFGATIGPSAAVDSTGGSVGVTAVGAWILRVSGTDGGKLKATADALCTGSTSVLNNALRAFPTASLGNFTSSYATGTPLTMSGTAQQIASGTGSNALTLTYRHVPNASDQFTAGCPYTMTSTVALAAT